MKSDNKTMLEAFEETGGRGDVLSLPLAYLKRMQAVPFDWFASVLHQLFKWFVSGDETPLEDPIANAELEGLKEEQRRNALRRKAFLVAQAERSERGVAARKKKQEANIIPRNTEDNPRVTHGLPDGNPTITKTVTVNRNPNQSEGYGLRRGLVGRAADAPPSQPITATAKEEAVRRIYELAPPIDEKRYDDDWIAEWRNYPMDDTDFVVGDILGYIDEVGNAQTENALKKYSRELGSKMFFYAYVKFSRDRKASGISGDEWENPGAILMSRLKRLKEAKSAWDKALSTTPNPCPTSGGSLGQ